MHRGLSRHNSRSGGNIFSPRLLFANGTQGVWFDDSNTDSMFQDSAGTIPAALESPVGKQLDLSGNNNHRTQTTNAKRPTLSARYNLLTKTEALDNSAWNKDNCTISANATTDPIGGLTADKIVSAATTAATGVGQGNTVVATSYTGSIYAKASEARYIQLLWNTPASTNYANFDLQTGTITAGTYTNATITDAGNGWYRLTITSTLTAGTYSLFSWIQNSGTAARAGSYTGNGTNGLFVWGADLRPANQATGLIPLYQRVDTSSVYDTVGFPQYIKYDGSSQSLSTASVDFTATAQVTVFAGLRKLSDSATEIFTELSASSLLNIGTFYITAPNSAAANYGIGSGGLLLASAASASSFAAPITNTLNMAANISAPSLNANINNVSAITNTATQGIGNYGNYALYFGARGGSSLYFNGAEFQTIIVGKTLTATEISNTETYVNSKTKAY